MFLCIDILLEFELLTISILYYIEFLEATAAYGN